MNRKAASRAIRNTSSENLLEAPDSEQWDERILHRGPARHARDAGDPEAELDEVDELEACEHLSGTGRAAAAADPDHGCCG